MFTTEGNNQIATDAAAQEEGEWTIFWLTLAGVIFSFAAIFTDFADIKIMPDGHKSLHVLLVATTLFASWLMTHVTFAFRYAHEYYSNDCGRPGFDEGLSFPGDEQPDYLDFKYSSLVLGMTFQVSDVQITARKFRRLAAVRGLPGQYDHTGSDGQSCRGPPLNSMYLPAHLTSADVARLPPPRRCLPRMGDRCRGPGDRYPPSTIRRGLAELCPRRCLPIALVV